MMTSRGCRNGHAGPEVLILAAAVLYGLFIVITSSLIVLGLLSVVGLVYAIGFFLLLRRWYPKQSCLARLALMVAPPVILSMVVVLTAFATSSQGDLLIRPVHMAGFVNSRRLARLGFAAGFTANGSVDHRAPLHFAAVHEDPKLIPLLIEHGADPNRPTTDDGRTALHVAARYSGPDMIRCLVEHGATVDARDEVRHETPLFVALRRRSLPVVEALIQAGADPKATDVDGRSASSYADEHDEALHGLLGRPGPGATSQ